jgi:hypothetical protein
MMKLKPPAKRISTYLFSRSTRVRRGETELKKFQQELETKLSA